MDAIAVLKLLGGGFWLILIIAHFKTLKDRQGIDCVYSTSV